MSNINYELEFLFGRWYERIIQNGGKNITKDGIMFQNDKTDEQVEKEWKASPKRVVILLKDQHQFGDGEKWNENINLWLKDIDWENTVERDKWNAKAAFNRDLKSKFLRNIAYILWGLIKIDKNNDWWYGQVEMHHEEVKKLFNTQPFALVECKKEPGGGKLEDKILRQHLDDYGDLLRKEIDVLNPNMIVCTNGIIYDFVLKMYPEDELTKIEGQHNSIRYHRKTDTFIFCSYHPSASNYGKLTDEDIYEGVMCHYRAFLQFEYASEFLK